MGKHIMKKEISKNKRAEEIVGLREIGGNVIPIDQPCELGYHCPVCKYELESDGSFDERLHWSEYNGFLWCSVCNKDYPSCMCLLSDVKVPEFLGYENNLDRAIEYYLNSIAEAVNRAIKRS